MATARKISVLLGVGRPAPSRRLHSMRARRDSRSCYWMLGGGIVVTHAGDLIGEVCLAGEMGGDPIEVGKTIRIRHCANRSDGSEAFTECTSI
jgi:hypothetical protein